MSIRIGDHIPIAWVVGIEGLLIAGVAGPDVLADPRIGARADDGRVVCVIA